MDINERVVKIIESEGLTVAAFARAIGIADQTVRSVCVLKRNKPGYDFLSSIVQTFAWVNPKWLLTGEGDMAMSQMRGSAPENGVNNLKELIIYLKERDARIERLIEERTTWKVLYEQMKTRVEPV